MDQTLTDMPRLRGPAVVNAAQYWLAPERFAHRCEQLGDRFLVPMPATGPWLCLTDPDDIKRVFTADTDVLRLGAALAKASAHHLFLGPTGLTNLDGAEHMRERRMQLPPFQGHALSGYHETMERKTEETLARWPYGRPTPSQPHMEAISLEVIMATVFGVTDPARVERLHSATLALLRKGHSRRFFLQTMIATSRENGWDKPFPRVHRAIDAVDAIVVEEATHRRHEEKLEGEDVLGMLLRTPDDQGRLMSDNEICDAMRTLLLGGHDTTASTLTWVLERVSRFPDALSRLQTAALDGDDEYLDAVIKEAMRLRPAFPLTARLATEPFELPGLTIPSGTMVVPLHNARAPPPRALPRPAHLPPRAFPGHPRRHLHLDPLRGRTETMHRRCLLPHRGPNRTQDNPAPRPPRALQPASRASRSPQRIRRARTRGAHHTPTTHTRHQPPRRHPTRPRTNRLATIALRKPSERPH
jgi:cytochrome P450